MGSEPELRSIEETHYLGHRFEVTVAVNDAVDGAFAEVFGWLGVVADAEPGEGDPLVAATLPAGRFVTYLHHGAYRSATEPDLAAARARVERWGAERGLELDRTTTDRGSAIGCYLERYLVGPAEEPDHSRWRTEIAYLVAWP